MGELTREQKYAEAIHATYCGVTEPDCDGINPIDEEAARAIMAVADAEQAELLLRALGAEAEASVMRGALARVKALADELDSLAEPYLTGSMFFDAAPTTRLRARASVRKDVAAAIRTAAAAR